MQIVDEEMQLEAPDLNININAGPPVSPINYLDDEIPLDQLMGSEDEGSPEQPEQSEHADEDIQMIDEQ